MASWNGVLSKFQERLRKIRLSRSKKKSNVDDNKVDDNNEKKDYVIVRNGLVVDKNRVRVGASRGIVQNNGDKIIKRRDIDIGVKVPRGVVVDNNYRNINKNDDSVLNRNNDNKVKNIKNGFKGKKIRAIGKDKKLDDKKKISENKKEVEIKKFEENLLDKIRESFKDKLDELEVLEGELYLISVEKDYAVVKKKIDYIKRRINVLIEEFNKVVNQYNAYKKNYYIDNILPIDDENIVDDLAFYRNMINSLDDEKDFVKGYKNYVEFGYLYDTLKRVKAEVDGLKEETINKEKDIEKRDKKYRDICDNINNDVRINNGCIEEINRQNDYFDDLMSKIDKINHEEYVTYHLKGLDELFSMSLRYIGLLLISPLSGIIPGIAAQTMVTKKLIGNISKNMHLEKVNHIRYSAIDYNSELNRKLSDINYTEDLIDDTLKDIVKMKRDFMSLYDSRIPGIDDTLNKIKSVEEIVLRNRNKVIKIKERINKSKKKNSDKLIRVKEMNNSN